MAARPELLADQTLLFHQPADMLFGDDDSLFLQLEGDHRRGKAFTAFLELVADARNQILVVDFKLRFAFFSQRCGNAIV